MPDRTRGVSAVSAHAAQSLARWRHRLGLSEYRIELERISPLAVCDEHNRVGNSLVGIVADHKRREATIFHTRRLTEEDIVHEMLHLRHPEWSEDAVVDETHRVLAVQPPTLTRNSRAVRTGSSSVSASR
jgi:hypothetical protein